MVFQPGEDVVAKVEKFRRGANYTAMWLPKMEWIVSIAGSKELWKIYCSEINKEDDKKR